MLNEKKKKKNRGVDLLQDIGAQVMNQTSFNKIRGKKKISYEAFYNLTGEKIKKTKHFSSWLYKK